MEHPAVIVTGASRGLGAMAARAAAEFGANVVLSARSVEGLRAAAEQVAEAGGQALVVAGDVSREADCQDVVEQAVARFGRIDGLVNNAGIIEPIARIAQSSLAAWELNWRINFMGPLMLTQLALPELRKAHGRVINISSGSSTAVIQSWGAYSSAKAAIDHLTRILAAEEPEITALAVRPGIVDTAMQATIRETGRETMAPADYGRLAGMHEQGRLVPAEVSGRAIAALALFAPHEWSGETVQWDDEKVRRLVEHGH